MADNPEPSDHPSADPDFDALLANIEQLLAVEGGGQRAAAPADDNEGGGSIGPGESGNGTAQKKGPVLTGASTAAAVQPIDPVGEPYYGLNPQPVSFVDPSIYSHDIHSTGNATRPISLATTLSHEPEEAWHAAARATTSDTPQTYSLTTVPSEFRQKLSPAETVIPIDPDTGYAGLQESFDPYELARISGDPERTLVPGGTPETTSHISPPPDAAVEPPPVSVAPTVAQSGTVPFGPPLPPATPLDRDTTTPALNSASAGPTTDTASGTPTGSATGTPTGSATGTPPDPTAAATTDSAAATPADRAAVTPIAPAAAATTGADTGTSPDATSENPTGGATGTSSSGAGTGAPPISPAADALHFSPSEYSTILGYWASADHDKNPTHHKDGVDFHYVKTNLLRANQREDIRVTKEGTTFPRMLSSTDKNLLAALLTNRDLNISNGGTGEVDITGSDAFIMKAARIAAKNGIAFTVKGVAVAAPARPAPGGPPTGGPALG